VWLRAIASTTHGARDDAQVPPQEDADDRAGLGFRPAARYTACTGFCSALTAPMFGRPGGSPVFLVSEHELAGGPLADSEHVRRGGTPSGQVTRSPRSGRGRADLRSRPVRSALVHTTVPGDLRLSGERTEPIPDRRVERMAELVASGPPLDIDQLVAIKTAQHDPVGATSPPGAAAERNHSDGGAALLELVPDRGRRQELPPAWAEPRLVCARRLPSRRRAARLARRRLTRRARPGPPSTSDVEPGQRPRLAEGRRPAARAGSGATRRAPTPRATGRGRSRPSPHAEHRGRDSRGELVSRRTDVARLSCHRADPAARRRSAGGPRSALESRSPQPAELPSIFRPSGLNRPDFGSHERTLRIAAVCWGFVPIGERR